MAKLKSSLYRFFILVFLAVFLASILSYIRPTPLAQPRVTISRTATINAISLPWPSYGQAAIGAVNFGVLSTHGQQTSVPIASVAKIFTALAIVNQKPLSPGQSGPTITIGDQDVGFYQKYVAADGSVVPVNFGEKITEYQALQALLLPSANNMADTLVTWAFGSVDNYISYASQLTQKLGLNQTRIADASGFSNQTISSARDLVLLGEAAMKTPLLAEIVSQSRAEIPVAGTIQSTNRLLGSDGIIGIKTGNTVEAGGCYLFASKQTIGKRLVTIVGSVVGADSLSTAMNDAEKLAIASKDGFTDLTLATRGSIVGYYDTDWGDKVPITAKNNLELLAWNGSGASLSPSLKAIKAPKPNGTVVGSLDGFSGQQKTAVPLILGKDLNDAPWHWRVFH